MTRGQQLRLSLTTPEGLLDDVYCVVTEVSEEEGWWGTLRIINISEGASERLLML